MAIVTQRLQAMSVIAIQLLRRAFIVRNQWAEAKACTDLLRRVNAVRGATV